MNPPTEQLIRDYLNRLSVAARSRLGFTERQALLDRTRAAIEASVGGMSGATAPKVRRALADLGDPIALVEHEWARHQGRDGRGAAPGAPVTQAGHASPAVQAIRVPGPVPGGGAAGTVVRVPAARRGGRASQAGQAGQDGPPAQAGQAGAATPGGAAGGGDPAGLVHLVSLPASQPVSHGGSAAEAVAANTPTRGKAAVAANSPTRAGHSAPASPARPARHQGGNAADERAGQAVPAHLAVEPWLPAGWASPSLTGEQPASPAVLATPAFPELTRPGPRGPEPMRAAPAGPTGPPGPAAVAAMPVPAGPSVPGEFPSGTAGPSGGSGTGDGSGSGSSSEGSAPAPDAARPPLPRQVPPDEQAGDSDPGQHGPGQDGTGRPDHSGPGSPGAVVAVPAPGNPVVAELPADEEIYEAELVRRPADLVRQATDVAGRRLAVTSRVLARHGWRAGASLLALAMRDKLETLAILLLGVGGAAYPPVWIIGAILVVVSPKWDGRDKLLGLVLPVLLVLFGAVMVVALGGVRATMAQYGLEGWLAVGRLARVGAVIGAVYLLRRVYRGRRAPKPPPWGRPPGLR